MLSHERRVLLDLQGVRWAPQISLKSRPFQSNLTTHLCISGAFPNSNHHLANKPSHINHPSPFKHDSHPSEKNHTPIFSSLAFNTYDPHNTRHVLPVLILGRRRTRTVRSHFPSPRPKQTSTTRLQTRPSLCTRRIPRDNNIPLPRSRWNKFRSSPLPPLIMLCVHVSRLWFCIACKSIFLCRYLAGQCFPPRTTLRAVAFLSDGSGRLTSGTRVNFCCNFVHQD